LGQGNLFENATVKEWRTSSTNTTYTTLFGRRNPVRDRFSQLTLDLQQAVDPHRDFRVTVRTYDDGVAYRLGIPQQADVDTVEVTDESTKFRLPGNPRLWPLYRENYTTSHEGRYAPCNLHELGVERLIDLPLLAEYSDGFSLALSEAALRDYAGLYLQAEYDGQDRRLRCDLSPLPGHPGVKVRSSLPLQTPWRVILLGRQPGRLIESNLILSLNDPSIIRDTSWLRSGKTTWYWWNGPYQEPVPFRVGLNWETMKHYIDFCARNGIAFHSIMSTPDGYPWYWQSQHGYGPGRDSDVTRPREGFPMERVADYAKARGVRLRLWAHWKPLSEGLEEAFAQYEEWGIAGLMVDFLDRDDQEMVRFAERVLESAARHHLHIQFHGVWKPTGLRRTYPNLLNHEGVLNLEYLKWSAECDPEHNLTVPFTRMLAGPLDYHSGGFRSVNRADFKPSNFQPVVLGSRCHHLAMYVVYENPMPMVADAPSAYEGQPGWDFVRDVPTTWDETRVLLGQVGDAVVMARRNGDDWYVGAMTDWTPRKLEVPLTFLSGGRYQATVWADDLTGDDPNRLVVHRLQLSAGDVLPMQLRSGGGHVVRLTSLNQ
jgi:alpha-glucosidase